MMTVPRVMQLHLQTAASVGDGGVEEVLRDVDVTANVDVLRDVDIV